MHAKAVSSPTHVAKQAIEDAPFGCVVGVLPVITAFGKSVAGIEGCKATTAATRSIARSAEGHACTVWGQL